MAKIVVFGGTGYAGSALVKEAKARGHDVSSVSRKLPASPIEGVRYLTSSANDAVEGAEIVIAAMSPRGDNAGKLFAIYQGLARASAKVGARFVAIGGFSSLRPAPGAQRFAEGGNVPPQYVAEATEMNAIRAWLDSGATQSDWLYVSPGAEFGSHVPGEALGHYRVGEDVALFDDKGKSAISGADFAKAVVDEIDHPTRHRGQIHFAY